MGNGVLLQQNEQDDVARLMKQRSNEFVCNESIAVWVESVDFGKKKVAKGVVFG